MHLGVCHSFHSCKATIADCVSACYCLTDDVCSSAMAAHCFLLRNHAMVDCTNNFHAIWYMYVANVAPIQKQKLCVQLWVAWESLAHV